MTSIKEGGTELRNGHRLVLASAAERQDGLVVPPDRIRGAVRRQVLGKLEQLGLIKELPIGDKQPHRATHKAGSPNAFAITDAGRRAISHEVPSPRPEGEAEDDGRRPSLAPASPAAAVAASRPRSGTPREGSKQALLIALLNRPDGASLGDLVSATGWLPHTTRAALTRLRQGGHYVEKRKAADGTTVYRIPSGSALVEMSGPRRSRDGR